MEEVLPGVFHWSARHPRIGIEVDCHHLAGSGTAIDPLLPAEGIEWFGEHPVERVVLSCRHHLRDAERLVERFACPILAHESGLHEFEGGPEVEGFRFGDRLADEVTALEMAAICPDDTVLRIDVGDGALLFGDALIHSRGGAEGGTAGEVGFVPDHLIGDEPERVKELARERFRALEGERFEHLLFAHGAPLLGDGRRALREVAGE